MEIWAFLVAFCVGVLLPYVSFLEGDPVEEEYHLHELEDKGEDEDG